MNFYTANLSLLFMPPPSYEPGSWTQGQLMSYYLPWITLTVKLFKNKIVLQKLNYINSLVKSYAVATIQVSHLALVCDLSRNEKDRIWLNSIRNAFTVVSAIIVHISLMLLLGNDSADLDNDAKNSTLGKKFEIKLLIKP